MNFSELKMRVQRAIDTFYARDFVLLRQEVSEWAIAHRLAVYLEQEIPGWNVDCEYNRQGRGLGEKRNDDNELVRPDIILHHRNQTALQHNLLAIELKKREEDSDLAKVSEFTAPPTANRPFQYQYGLALSFLEKLKSHWFENGKEMPQDTNAPNSIVLYRYLDASAALKSIESRSLKIGRLRDFNDPFEWRMGITGIIPEGEVVAQACMEGFIDDVNRWMGIVCLSDVVTDPVLWSHYANKHQGVAFEVSYVLDPERLIKMDYTNERPVFNANHLHDPAGIEKHAMPLLNQLLRQKSTGWAYEREYRVFLDLRSCDISGGLYFKRIPDHFLKRVILGYKCPLEELYVLKALEASGLTETKVVRAKMCLETYSIRVD